MTYDTPVEYGPCSCANGERCRYINGNAACMSDTPRTDALPVSDPMTEREATLFQHARTLERELAAAQAAYENLRAHWEAERRCDFPEHSAARARVAELEAWIAWLEVRIVDVRTPAMWGSHHEFTAQPSDDCVEGEEVGPSNLRDLLRGALARKP